MFQIVTSIDVAWYKSSYEVVRNILVFCARLVCRDAYLRAFILTFMGLVIEFAVTFWPKYEVSILIVTGFYSVVEVCHITCLV